MSWQYIPSLNLCTRAGMVKRTLIGAILTLIAEYIALILYAASHGLSVHITPMRWIAPNISSKFGYLIFTISLLEFIVAQSPQSMRALQIQINVDSSFNISNRYMLKPLHIKYVTAGLQLFYSHQYVGIKLLCCQRRGRIS